MTESFYFYDLETSGINPRTARIMQFAGQRTTHDLEPIGEPDNILIKLTDDILPEPDAVLITGITPQKTRAEGISEIEFLQYFNEHIVMPGTIFTGFNSIRFDDEFLRFTHYRNFYDAYEWSWRDGRSRWDLLDVIRMTRALRPDEIKWPFDVNGKPSNRLELLTSLNKLEHTDAHDALSDVRATIAVARLLRSKQPRLFDYLLGMRHKKKVEALVGIDQPFVYSSGKYPSLYQKTTVAVRLGAHPGKQGALVFDLRHDPTELHNMSAKDISIAWRLRVDDETKRFPVKTLQYNRCPAVAPLSVLQSHKEAQDMIKIDLELIKENFQKLKQMTGIYAKLCDALVLMDTMRQTEIVGSELVADEQLYDGFFPDQDRAKMSLVRGATDVDIMSLEPNFSDTRLQALFPLYKARNFKQRLSPEETLEWESFRVRKLLNGGGKSQVALFFSRLQALMNERATDAQALYLLEELRLYGESIVPDTGSL